MFIESGKNDVFEKKNIYNSIYSASKHTRRTWWQFIKLNLLEKHITNLT